MRRVITVTSVIVLTLVCLAICAYQFIAARYESVYDLGVLADVIEANSTAALATQDPKAAVEILNSLRTNPGVLSARIYRNDGSLFAEYERPGATVPTLRPEQLIDGHRFVGWQLIFSRRVRSSNRTLGTLVLRSDMHGQYTRLRDYLTIVAILMVASTGVAFLLAARLQNVISGPILELVGVARGIAEKKDCSLRVERKSKDEVGLLVDAFNQMLDQIQERDTTLRTTHAELEKRSRELEVELTERQRAEERFRQLADSINEVFWMTNVEKTQMIYISPAYEQVWGRSCESLSKAPMNWMEAIHPDDRDRVRRAALSEQARGTYDEEYRIVRPSGAIRWIHDRAFPILDKHGKPYRIAGIAEDITERKLAEEDLRLQSEIARNMDEGVLLVRAADSTIVYANPKFEHMFGYGPGELKSQPTSVLTAADPAWSEEVAQQIVESLYKSGHWSGELHNRRKDGTEFWTYATISDFYHRDHGRVRVSVETDITEQKRAAVAVEKLAAIVESTEDAILSASLNGTIESWNASAERIYGYSAVEAIGQPITILAPPDRKDEPINTLKRVLTGERIQGFETVRCHKDGTPIPVSLTLSPIRGRDGRVVGASSIARDITARKQAQQELRLQSEIARNLEEGIVLLRASDATIIYANPKFERMFGYESGELPGKPIAIVNAASERSPEEIARNIIQLLNRDGSWGGEIHNRKKDGTEFWCYSNVSAFEHPELGRLWISISMDITERKRAESKLRQAEEKYRLLVERVPAITYIAELGESGRWHYVSPQIEPLLGFSPSEWMADPHLWARQLHPDDRGAAVIADKHSVKSGRYGAEYRLLTRDGRIVWCRDEGVLVRGEAGEPPLLQGVIHDITERKRAEAALRESESRFRQLAESLPQLVWTCQPDGPCDYLSRQWVEFTGVPEAQQLDFGWLNQIHPDDRDGLTRAWNAAVASGGVFQVEFRIRRHDGAYRWFDTRAVPLRDGSGKVVKWIGSNTDITERMRAEAAIRDSEQRLQGIIDNSTAVIYVKDRAGKYILINRCYESLFHIERDAIVGKTDHDIFPSELADKFRENDLRVLADKKPVQFEEVAPHDDGLHTYVSVKFPLFDSDGVPYAVCGISTDITERKGAEEVTRRLAAIVESTEDAIISGALDGTVLSWNNAAAKMYGYSAGEMIGKSLFVIVPPEIRGEVSGMLQKVRAGGVVSNYETVKMAKSGRRVNVSTTISPIKNEAGEVTGISVITHDITERKRAEHALQTQARALENMVEGVMVYDEHERILFTNHALDTMFGYEPGELIGQSTEVLNPFPPATCAQIAQEIRSLLQTQKSMAREFLNRRKDGSEFVSESRISKLQIDGQWCHVAVVQDISKRKRMEKEVVEISDREQRRIGQDLHDGLSQLLTGTAFAGKVLEERLAAKSSPEAGQAAKVVALLEQATSEARRVARGLHPVQLEVGGLSSALQELANSVQTLFGVACKFGGSDSLRVQDTATATHVYRIAQEAVNNAVRHSGASHITINLTQRRDAVTLAVTDDGKGLPKKPKHGSGMGMSIMAYRAQMIGGTIQVERRPKHGTRVACSFKIH